ncbi:MAG: response regulator [Magnetococcales bacterium]|nr:response regulator [Magnetococcales bacterium]
MGESTIPVGMVARILLVDDEPLTERLLRQILKQEEDLALYYCPDPAQAIQMAESIRPVLILTDLLMPEIDGITLIRQFRNRRAFSQLPILMLSNEEDPYVKAQAFAAGANDYLVKLPNRVELVARLRHHSQNFFRCARHTASAELCSDIIHSDLKGFWLIDARSKMIIDVNDNLCSMLGLSRESLLGHSPLDFVDAENRIFMQKALDWIPKVDKRVHEIHLITLTKERLYTRFCVTTTRNTMGRETVSAFTFLNLNKLNLEYFEILKNEFRFIADSVPGLLWLSNPDSQRIFFNQSWLKFRGAILEQELDDQWLQGLHPDDRARYQYCSNEAFQGHRAYSLEFRLKNSQGEYRWLYETALPRFAGNGFFMGFSGSCVDITERKMLEGRMNQTNYSLEQQVQTRTAELQHEVQERRQAEFLERRANQAQEVVSALLRIALEDLPLAEQLQRCLQTILAVPWLTLQRRGAIFLVDQPSQTLRLTAAEQLPEAVRTACATIPMGHCLCGQVATRGEACHTPCSDLVHVPLTPEVLAPHDHYCLPIPSGEKVLGVLNLYVETGHQFNPFEEEFLRTVSHVLTILIEHGQIDRLKDARRQADAENRAKSEFLATMSHEIRTPMNAIVGMAELLCAEEISPKARYYAQTMMRAGEALLTLINDILDYSKMSAGKVTLENDAFDLHQLLQGVLQLFEGMAQEKGLFLQLHLSDNLPQWVMGDSVRIWQVIVNLLSNAVKFTQEGGVTLTVLRLLEDPGEPMERAAIQIQVQDSGIGIAPEFFARLFKSFEQGEKTVTRRHGGTGLGLAITNMLVHLMAGEIEVESSEGVGSLFRITLPMALAVAPSPVTASSSTEQSQDAMLQSWAGCRILVAEDDSVNRVVVAGMLRRLGVTVELVEDGALALEKLRTQTYDLVFMDCQMPVLDGYSACRNFRHYEAGLSGHSRMPVIALTAFALQGDREKCLQAGMDDYMTKPVRGRDFQAMLAKWLPRG